MWAQLVKMRARPGTDEELNRVGEQWEEQVGRGTESGWVRTLTLRSATDPNEWYEITYFESEQQARTSERSPQHQAVLEKMMALVDGQPEFVDLTPVRDSSR